MAQCQTVTSAPLQRNRLCVTFEMDHETIGNGNLNHHQQQQQPNHHQQHRNSFSNPNNDRLCLLHDTNQGTNRRHSSELNTTAILPKVSISRANSDILLNTIGGVGAEKKYETKRTSAALKKLASYMNVKPRLKYKQHNYQRMTKVLNIKTNKCRICSETIYFHCYECIQCKLTGHKKCLQNLYVNCPNKIMPPRLAVFGLEISDNNQISEVLSTCIMEIEKRPVHKLRGIYKTDGNANIIENLCLSFEFGSHLIDLNQISPHDISGVVKRYLQQISTPFFNQALQKELITIGREWPVRKVPYTQSGIAILVFELRRLISCLQPAYRNNLAYLIYHLKRIVDRQNITEMTANSLAIIFAPIIFRDVVESSRIPKEHEKINGKNNANSPNTLKRSNSNGYINIPSTITTTTTTNFGVQILLDVTLKIRVIELMIFYANDIFANLE